MKKLLSFALVLGLLLGGCGSRDDNEIKDDEKQEEVNNQSLDTEEEDFTLTDEENEKLNSIFSDINNSIENVELVGIEKKESEYSSGTYLQFVISFKKTDKEDIFELTLTKNYEYRGVYYISSGIFYESDYFGIMDVASKVFNVDYQLLFDDIAQLGIETPVNFVYGNIRIDISESRIDHTTYIISNLDVIQEEQSE